MVGHLRTVPSLLESNCMKGLERVWYYADSPWKGLADIVWHSGVDEIEEFFPHGMLFEIGQQTALSLQMMEGCHFNNNKMLLLRNTKTNSDFFKLLSKYVYIRTDYVYICKKEINKLDNLPKIYFILTI